MASTSLLTATTQDAADAPVRQVPIVLRTSQPTLSIPELPYLVPTGWRRTQLSTLVNKLLQQDTADSTETIRAPKSIPFDFIINGELLRTSLSQYLESKGLTEESSLEIEYVRSTLPPSYTASFEHDDWISSVDASRDGLFLTSSYDGTLRVFGTSTATEAITTFRPSEVASLTKACWIPGTSNVASASMDGALRICSLPTDGKGQGKVQSVSFTNTFESALPLSSVAVNGKGDTLATSGWDGSIAIWDAAAEGEVVNGQDTSRSSKRRKGTKGGVADPDEVHSSKKPLSILWHSPPAPGIDRVPATNARVSGAVWSADRHVISAGWDGAVSLWDVSEGSKVASKSSDKVILCLDSLQASSASQTAGNLALTGHMDHSSALWDLRSSTTNISLSFSAAHAGPICAVRAHPTSSHLFVTGSHDGLVKLWDTRSPRAALFSVTRPPSSDDAKTHGIPSKVLALDWDNSGQTIVAGGEDCRLTVHRGHGIGREDVAA